MTKATGRTHLVHVLRCASTQDPRTNEEVKSWTPVMSALAARNYRNASEGQSAGGEVAAIRVLRFEIPWSPTADTITPVDRLEYRGAVFNITEVNEIGRREGVELFATARADGAAT